MQKDLQKSNLVDRCKFELDEPVFLSPFILKGADPADTQCRILCKSGTDARSMRATGGAKGRHLRQQCYEGCHIFVDQVGYGHECEIGDSCI